MTPLEAATHYTERGWFTVPIPYRSKNPGFLAWEQLRLGKSDLIEHFGQGPQNIGVLLGEPSGWLIDVDLDHPRCVELADQFLPVTPAEFGRPGKLRSHRIYVVSAPVATKKFKSKSAGMLVELRSTGMQTVFPFSTHESGELITWVSDNADPAVVDPAVLLKAVEQLANTVKREIGEMASLKAPREKKAPDTGKAVKNPRRTAERIDSCVNSMLRMQMVDQKDGSGRLYAAACRVVEHDLSDADGVSAIRAYASQRPFPVAWTDEQILTRIVADNKLHELSGWNFELLQTELSELKGLDVDLGVLGFNQDELAKILDPGVKDGLCDPDDVPEPPDAATTQPGDLWKLGDHRLLCGDSACESDVNRLLAIDVSNSHNFQVPSNGSCDILPIHLVNTDPPYNVKVEPRSNNAIAAGMSSFGEHGLMHHQSFDLHRAQKRTASRYHQMDVTTGAQSGKPTHRKLRPKDRPLANDFVSDEQFDEMLHAWFGNIARVLLPGRCYYLWGGWVNCANYPPVLKAKGLYFSQSIIWVKEHPVLTRKDFMGNHEWCFYGWREGAGHTFLGPNNATDVWSVKKINPNAMMHLTEKPVELAIRSIQYSSRQGENVLDLFGGSGSTMIAAEQTGRRAFLTELDGLYCDIIVARWEKFTGRKAERIPAHSPNNNGGESHE